MSGFGQQLKELREQKRVTVTEAASATHLDIPVIQAMENDEYSVLNAPQNASCYYQLYCGYLSTESEPYIQAYLQSFGIYPDNDKLAETPCGGEKGVTDANKYWTTDEEDELIGRAIESIRVTRRASISSIQRRLRIGYTQAARLIDLLEKNGLVGPPRGSEPREILFDLDGFDPFSKSLGW